MVVCFYTEIRKTGLETVQTARAYEQGKRIRNSLFTKKDLEAVLIVNEKRKKDF